MVQPIDQGAIIRSGMELVPNLAGQMVQERNLRLLEQANVIRQQQESRQLADASRKFERQQMFDADIAQIGADPSPTAIAGLMSKYPEFSEGLKRAWDAGSEEKRGRDMGQLGEIYSYLSSGNVERAKAVLRARVSAERAAGLEPDEESLLAMLEGGDQNAAKQVQAQVGMALAVAAGPDKFASAYGGLKPDKTTFEQEYDFILRTQGKAAADNFMRNKSDPLTPITNQYGTSIYRSSQLDPGRASAGDGAGGPAAREEKGTGSPPARKPVANAGVIARSLFPDVEVTQVRRDPKSSLGRKNPKSWHNRSGAAVDVAPISGMTFDQYVQRYKDAGYTILEQRDEVNNPSGHATGPHWHIVLGGGPAPEKAPSRVNTRQQYAKLPSGTTYVAPDGTTRVKP